MSVASRHLSYSHGTGNIPFLPYTIGQMLNKTADEYPDNEMYVFYADKERCTFREFRKQTHLFAAGLLQLGLQKGDRVAVWGNAHKEYMLTYHVCAQIGLILVRLVAPPATELNGQLLKRLGCKALVLNRTPADGYTEVCKLVPELPNSEPGKLNSDSLPDLKIVIAAEETFSNSKGVFTVGDVIKRGGSSDEAFGRITSMAWGINTEDEFSVLFTSGSTGVPKATTHSHWNLLNHTRMGIPYRKGTNFKADWIPKLVVIAPPAFIAHEYGVLNPIVTGQTTVFACPTYDVDTVLKAVHEERCNEGSFVIHHIHDLVNHPDKDKYDWSCMKVIMTGGSVIPDNVMKSAKEKLSTHVMLAYGSTECCVVFTQNPIDHPDKLSTGAVYPNPHTEIKIVDEEGRTVPTETIGEIWTRTYSLFKYYWADEDSTQNSKTKDGWFKTGDLGVMDDDGFFRVLGRQKDVIVKGSLTFFPKELEHILEQHSAVSKAVVFGVPDERLLEEVCACVKLEKSASIGIDDLKSFCKGKVHDYLVPQYIFLITELPTTSTGKFHRKEIRDWAIGQLSGKP